jgi:hypothetical protein
MLYYFGGDFMKAKIAITLDEEILNSVKQLAESESRTISSQINKILKDYLKERGG